MTPDTKTTAPPPTKATAPATKAVAPPAAVTPPQSPVRATPEDTVREAEEQRAVYVEGIQGSINELEGQLAPLQAARDHLVSLLPGPPAQTRQRRARRPRAVTPADAGNA